MTDGMRTRYPVDSVKGPVEYFVQISEFDRKDFQFRQDITKANRWLHRPNRYENIKIRIKVKKNPNNT